MDGQIALQLLNVVWFGLDWIGSDEFRWDCHWRDAPPQAVGQSNLQLFKWFRFQSIRGI